MDIEEHAEHVVSLRQLCLEVRADELDLGEANLEALWVIVSEKVPIHVLSLRVASIVACNDTVWVHDWRDPKLKHLSHLVADDFLGDEKVDEAMDYEGAVSLTAVLTPNYENYRFFDRLGPLALVCDLKKRNVYVSVGKAK